MHVDALLDLVCHLALELSHGGTASRPAAIRRALATVCRARGLLVSTRERVDSRGTPDAYRGRIALVVGAPKPRPDHRKPASLVALEFARRTPRAKSKLKLQLIPSLVPIRTAIILILKPRSEPPQPEPGIDRIVHLGPES